ncbi:PucR family transcriptional regulator [Gordonia sp. MMO-8]|uniref:PucR family transcriptional regulator n=1 Tax=Gordonia sp. MMO-8 TaxID=3127886 RepID=UPI003016A16A
MPSRLSLDDVIDALDTAVDWSVLVDSSVPIESVAILDVDDLSAEPTADVVLLVGVDITATQAWLREASDAGTVPAAILTKAVDSGSARGLVAEFGVGVVGIHARARWDRVLGLAHGAFDRARDIAGTEPADIDLAGLVALVAQGTGGLVSIEDATSARVLAYSPSNGEADDLRVQTILGREGPPTYLALLRKWGVFDAIRRGGEVVDVPDHPEEAMRRRMVIGVHSGAGRHLGSIWVQEGAQPLSDDAREVLTGAAAVASRILTREMESPTAEAQLLQRLFGEHGGVDASSAGAYLRWSTDEQSVVIGLGGTDATAMAAISGALRLHASAFAASALTTVISDRAYVLVPASSVEPVTRWAGTLVTRFDGDPALDGARLRAGVVFPVDGLAAVASGRAEVDRVLSATLGSPESARVTTLAQARTAVLLGEILDVLARRDDLVDPRITALVGYDADHSSQLVESVRAFLDAHGNVRDAAARIGIHANTLRYRIDRAQQVSGLRFDDPADRLLTSIQLACASVRDGYSGADR